MRIKLKREIDYYLCRPGLLCGYGSLLRLVLESAVKHSERAGYGTIRLLEMGYIWMLYKLHLKISRIPRYGETVTIETWSRKMRGYKAYRDFIVFAGDDIIATASSIWLFINTGSRKMAPIPAEMNRAFTAEEQRALDEELDDWIPDENFDPREVTVLMVRFADCDIAGHVNSAVYVDYITDALNSIIKEDRMMTSFRIQYIREIDSGTSPLSAGMSSEDGRFLFKIFGNDTLFAAGEIEAE